MPARATPLRRKQPFRPLDWWRAFRSRELTEIIEEARSSNLDIAVAVARIVQADAQARIAGAALLPIIDLNANAQHSQQSKTTGSSSLINVSRSGPSVAIINNNLSATLNASYEIDFWGKNRSALRAAEETAVASRYDREVVGLTTVVATANAYFQVLAAQDRLRVARENLASATRILNLIQQQYARRDCVRRSTSRSRKASSTRNVLRFRRWSRALQQNKAALAVLMARPLESVVVRGGSMTQHRISRA